MNQEATNIWGDHTLLAMRIVDQLEFLWDVGVATGSKNRAEANRIIRTLIENSIQKGRSAE